MAVSVPDVQEGGEEGQGLRGRGAGNVNVIWKTR